jgi:hypothetical protein
MIKEQQERQVGRWVRYSSKGRLVDEDVTAEKVASSVH